MNFSLSTIGTYTSRRALIHARTMTTETGILRTFGKAWNFQEKLLWSC